MSRKTWKFNASDIVRIAFAIAAIAAVMSMAVLIGGEKAGKACGLEEVYAEANYKYMVTVYSGRIGEFSGKSKVWRREFSFGERCEFDSKDLGLKITDDRYYARGFRIAGHDNDETTGSIRLNFNVTEDVSYEMAYGIKGDLVAYVVHYVDQDGNKIHDSDTYYGMAGDKPVVAYRYIEGYEPDTYNITKTLSKDESKNVFTFKYTRVKPKTDDDGDDDVVPALAPGTTNNPAETDGWIPTDEASDDDDDDEDDEDDDDDGRGGKNGGGNGQSGWNGQGGQNGQNGQQFTDIDDTRGPAAIRNFIKKVAEKVKDPVVDAWLVGLLVFLILLFIFFRRRRKKDEEEAEAEAAESAADGEAAAAESGCNG